MQFPMTVGRNYIQGSSRRSKVESSPFAFSEHCIENKTVHIADTLGVRQYLRLHIAMIQLQNLRLPISKFQALLCTVPDSRVQVSFFEQLEG